MRTASDGVQIDERGKVPGRGAYLCHTPGCWQSALSGSALAHALHTELSEIERARLEVFANRLAAAPQATVENSA